MRPPLCGDSDLKVRFKLVIDKLAAPVRLLNLKSMVGCSIGLFLSALPPEFIELCPLAAYLPVYVHLIHGWFT